RSTDSLPTVAAEKSTQASETLYRVTGRVAQNNIDVRVFDATTSKFVVSQRADWRTSRYSFNLPNGKYIFEVDDNRLRITSPYFYRQPYRTAPITVASNFEVPEIPLQTSIGHFSVTARFPCDLAAERPTYAANVAYSAYFEITTEDGTRIARPDGLG